MNQDNTLLTEKSRQEELLKQLETLPTDGRGDLRTYWTTPHGKIPQAYIWQASSITENPKKAVLVSSLCRDKHHKLALDIDWPAEFVTDAFGRKMLRIDRLMLLENIIRVHNVMEEIGLLDGPRVNLSGIYLHGKTNLLPSRTKGNFHLYNDTPLEWDDYKKLLEVLADTYIIEERWYRMSLHNGMTRLRIRPYLKAELHKA